MDATTIPSLIPAISPNVHLSLTIVYIILYLFLFVWVYIQLWLVLYYRHKRCSYQTILLFLCLLWAALRTSLFSFYFNNCVLANSLNTVLYWLLYCFPVCLQFVCLGLLVLFFAQVYFKSSIKNGPNKCRKWLPVVLLTCTVTFLATNIACAIVGKHYEAESSSIPSNVYLIRVVINDGLFFIFGIILSSFIYKISKISTAGRVLEAGGATMLHAVVLCLLITFLYTSRTLYNIIAVSRPLSNMLSFGYGWINVSDQADFQNLNQGLAYLCFGIVLFVWEYLPTFLVVIFFRVKKPVTEELVVIGQKNNGKHPNNRAYFFDNPRRYDSDDEVSVRSFSPRNSYRTFEAATSINTSSSTSSTDRRSFGNTHGLPSTPPVMLTTTGSLQPQFYDGT